MQGLSKIQKNKKEKEANKLKNQYEYTQTGETCLSILKDTKLLAHFTMPYQESLKIVKAHTIIKEKKYNLEVFEKSPEIDGATGWVEVKMMLNNTKQEIPPGFTCKVILP